MRLAVKALLILPALIVGGMLLSSGASRATCSYYGFQTDRETRYAAFLVAWFRSTVRGSLAMKSA